MKNLFILPKHNTTKLGLCIKDMSDIKIGAFHFFGSPILMSLEYWKPHCIYITTDDSLKKGDWCLDKYNQVWLFDGEKLLGYDSFGGKRFSTDNVVGHECKKIILTTDQELIEKGVQAIGDEFLEWFIKNPTCEFAEYDRNLNRGNLKYYYKVITPSNELECKTNLEKMVYSQEEVLEHLNLMYSMKNSKLDTFTDENDYITEKWFEQFKK